MDALQTEPPERGVLGERCDRAPTDLIGQTRGVERASAQQARDLLEVSGRGLLAEGAVTARVEYALFQVPPTRLEGDGVRGEGFAARAPRVEGQGVLHRAGAVEKV